MSEYRDQFINIPMDTPRINKRGCQRKNRTGNLYPFAVGSVTGYAVLVVLNFATGDSLTLGRRQ